jgi:hypothetical protein
MTGLDDTTEKMHADLRQYVDDEIRAAFSGDWQVTYSLARTSGHLSASESRLQDYEWTISNSSIPGRLSNNPDLHHYKAYPDNRGKLVFVFGNTDVGVTTGTVPERALLIDLQILAGLLAYIHDHYDEYPMNEYGFT